MFEKLIFDDGMLELEVNDNGVLRFNPSDFNVYRRFFALMKDLPELEQKYRDEMERVGGGDDIALAGEDLEKAHAFDQDVKGRLSEVFGPQNDFDVLTGGVNLMARGKNGEMIVANLLNALKPYMERGAEQHMKAAAAEAVSEAKANRAQRRAKQ